MFSVSVYIFLILDIQPFFFSSSSFLVGNFSYVAFITLFFYPAIGIFSFRYFALVTFSLVLVHRVPVSCRLLRLSSLTLLLMLLIIPSLFSLLLLFSISWFPFNFVCVHLSLFRALHPLHVTDATHRSVDVRDGGGGGGHGGVFVFVLATMF